MNERLDLTVSIVIYKDNKHTITKLLDILDRVALKKMIIIIDNSPGNNMESVCNRRAVKYIYNNRNIGFGRAHNKAIKNVWEFSKYHLIMNPDIYFAEGTIEDIYRFMEDNSSIGMLMPKVLYPDGSLQHLCRLLPSPFILLVRKMNFPPFKSLAARKNQEYELRFADYNKIIEAPYLSGCFMFVRSEVFRKVGIFDERFFLYLEDVDLSRRISRFYKTLYYPQAVIYHGYRKGSYKNVLLLVHHISSAIKYFNKWGWFFDEERKGINNKTLCTLSKVI